MCIFCGGACGGVGETLAYPLLGGGVAYTVIKIQGTNLLKRKRKQSEESESQEHIDEDKDR